MSISPTLLSSGLEPAGEETELGICLSGRVTAIHPEVYFDEKNTPVFPILKAAASAVC